MIESLRRGQPHFVQKAWVAEEVPNVAIVSRADHKQLSKSVNALDVFVVARDG